MTRKFALTGIGIQTGHNVSNSNVKTKRIFAPNLQKVTLKSEMLNQNFSFKLTTRTIRTITKYGGLDEYLLHTKSQHLTELGLKLKHKLKKIPSVIEKIKSEADVKKTKRVIKPSARSLLKKKVA